MTTATIRSAPPKRGGFAPGAGTDAPAGVVERRIQRMGSFSVGISLPRAWLEERHRSVGDSLRIRRMDEGGLLVWDAESETRPTLVSVPTSADEVPEHLFRRLIAAYLTGAGAIEVSRAAGISAEARAVVRSFVRRTVQFEIVTEDENRLVLQDMTRGPDLSIPALLHRMAQMVHDLHRRSLQVWNADAELSRHAFEEQDDEIDRYGWLIERVLRIRLDPRRVSERDPSGLDDPLEVLLLVRALERVGDHAVRLAGVQADLAPGPTPSDLLRSIRSYHEQVLEFLESASALGAGLDIRRVNEVLDAGDSLRQMGATLEERLLALEESPGRSYRSIHALGTILESLGRVSAYAQDIAEVALDRSLLRDARTVAIHDPESRTTPERNRKGGKEKIGNAGKRTD